MSEGNGRAWTPEIKELGDKIAALTVSRAVELGDYMEQVHGIKAAAAAVAAAPVAGPGGGGAAAPAAPVEKTEFTVVIASVPDQTKKLGVIKAVRELVQGLGLKEAKELVDTAPKPLKENVTKDEAEAMKKKLEEAGAKVELK